MVYDIVLKSGKELQAVASDSNEVLNMLLQHSIYIVRESEHPSKATYIIPGDVSHIRFPLDGKNVARPVE